MPSVDTWYLGPAFVDRVADLDVRVAVAMRAHVPRGGEAGPQVGLRVLHGDQQRLFRVFRRGALVEHVRVRVDEPRQQGGLAEVDHLNAGRNLHGVFRADIGNPIAGDQHDPAREHLARGAVEQAPRADGDRTRRGNALVHTAVGAGARRRSRAAPRRGRRLHLRRCSADSDDAETRGNQKSLHVVSPSKEGRDDSTQYIATPRAMKHESHNH